MIFLDLVTDKGQLIRVECPDDHFDAFFDSITYSLKLGDTWSPSMFDGCSAEFHGMRMERIDMSKIIGTLQAMHHAILKTDDLKDATGYKQIADVEKCLTKQGIRFFRGKDGIWTTLGLVEAAGGLRPAQEHDSSSIL